MERPWRQASKAKLAQDGADRALGQFNIKAITDDRL
jgi:hypothetical protein